MKSQQTLRHSDTRLLITTQSVNQPVTPWLAMTIMSDHSLPIGDSPLIHWDSSLTLILNETETETGHNHIISHSTIQPLAIHHRTSLARRWESWWMVSCQRKTDFGTHRWWTHDHWRSLEITENHWESLRITENHRVSQCHTDEHRLPQSDTDSQRGAARNMDSHIVSMWHWVMNGIGWWFSWSLGIGGDEYHSVVASMGIIWTQRHRWTLTGWWHSLDGTVMSDDTH